MASTSRRRGFLSVLLVGGLIAAAGGAAGAGEPDPATYWDIKDIRPGMTGKGRTVMVEQRLEDFEAEVLGVMRDVSPGRDMVLCRLKGCKLEHSGIIQGMSGSPIYIDGKLLGAVAYAWEFAKDPIAGVTPFAQMVQYVRSNDRRIAAESRDRAAGAPFEASAGRFSPWIEGLSGDEPAPGTSMQPVPVSGGAMGGMTPIVTPLAASGFSPRALGLLADRLRPIGMAPMAGGGAPERVIREMGDRPLVPGAPLSIGLVLGDFDLSGIGTVTHVEGNRVYGFGHPMMSLGACELPMMTGYIHTVYPRASVSMKMGSPLKIVGVIDTDVSTSVAGRVGATPDMLPMSVRVKTGRYSDARTYHVRVVREPSLMPSLIMAVLTNAIDTEGNLPEELTAHLTATIKLMGHDPITMSDIFSGPRYTGQMGPSALFNPLASIVNILVRNPMTPVRIEAVDCVVEIEPGRKVATIESVRLLSDTVEPGHELKGFVTLKPFKGERETIEISLPIPAGFPEGAYEASFGDAASSLKRAVRNDPSLIEPHDLAGILRSLKVQIEPKRTAVYLQVPAPDKGVSIQGQALPNLPGSVRAVFNSKREVPVPTIRSDLTRMVTTPWVVEGAHSLRFTVVKDAGLSVSL